MGFTVGYVRPPCAAPPLPRTYLIEAEHVVPGLQEVVLQRLPYEEAVGVARTVTDGE